MPDAPTNKCPICKKDTVAAFRPFCSRRCADIDLGNWLKGNYAIPAEEPVSEEEFDEIDRLSHPHRAH